MAESKEMRQWRREQLAWQLMVRQRYSEWSAAHKKDRHSQATQEAVEALNRAKETLRGIDERKPER